MPTNRHPVDELADVRAEMRRLKDREAELREIVLSEACGLTGDQVEASIRTSSSTRIDTEKLWREMGTNALKPYLRENSTTTLIVKAREIEEAA